MILTTPIKPEKWIEECKDKYVIVLINPCGVDFRDENIIETTQHLIKLNCEATNSVSIINMYPASNIWRSWMTYSDKICEADFGFTPLIIDIDNSDQNIHNAYKLTVDCLSVIEQMKIPEMFCRVVFSGKKGFHIELKSNMEIKFNNFRDNLINNIKEVGPSKQEYFNIFSTGVIDVAHEFIRVTGSIHSWKENLDLYKRKVIQFSVGEFTNLDVEKILNISETI